MIPRMRCTILYKNRIFFVTHTEKQMNILFLVNFLLELNEAYILNANDSSGRNNDKQKTMTMTKEYNISAKHLHSLLAKAERILVCMQTCRKYETQDEKILPPVGSHSPLLTQSTVVEDDDLPFELVKQDFGRLDSFWHRLGFTRVIVEELRMERNRLVMRRNDLRDSIKCWFMSETYFNA
ncbi:dynein regulatory complex subunit 2-like [Hylaeus volcanicus]|uniref:dynein regulatory complex subunit 2-like n=1 Tax=Hylaeus volcanicus TaxID=313075 RepID=UPI0023B84AA6|nr:dynein regulatory complex subunit 2-like [Hylaeus volcanicus]